MASMVVVGLDGSQGSIWAMQWAVDTAQRIDATIQPVLAWEYPTLALLPFPAGIPVPPQEAMQADAEDRATGLVQSAGVWGDLDVATPLVRQGSPGRVLCDVAAAADLLVIGSRGLGSVRGVLLGSVGSHCASAAPCPVALIPFNEGVERPVSNVVVVGVDGSSQTEEVVTWADKWAPDDAVLLLVHSWNLPVLTDGAAMALDSALLENAAIRLVDEAALYVKNHQVETMVVRGDPRVELRRLATDADALVLGATGHSVFERFLMGSVAAHIVHNLEIPTILVRHPE